MSTVTAIDEYRGKIQQLEDAIISLGEPVELEVRHYFAHGTYTRELFIPKGTVLTGKIHIHSCINIVTKGKILAITDTGRHEIEAPHVFVSAGGLKKGGYAMEDTIWINVHPWDGPEDLELIEQSVIAPNYELLAREVTKCLG